MHVVIFEGSNWQAFAPLTVAKPVFALASGMSTLVEKQVRALKPTRLTLWVRPELARYCAEVLTPRLGIPVAVNQPLDDEPAMLVNGRTFFVSRVEETGQAGVVIEKGNLVRRAVVRSPGLSAIDEMQQTAAWRKLFDLPAMDDGSRMVHHLWDLIDWNKDSIVADFGHIDDSSSKPAGAYHLLNDRNVWIGADVKIEPGVVLDGSSGPVVLGRGCSVGANSVLKGPCYVGEQSQVKPLTVIHAGTTIGAVCKVGGEISNSIITAYSNKSHEGYLGDSYLGEWVNLGAGTTTSNLKNTYGSVKVRIGSREIDTGLRSLGSLIGDHSKTAIGTRLMTGSYVGYCSMIASSAHPPTFVPSFCFITDKGREAYRMDKAMDVMKQVYARRGKTFGEADAELVRYASVSAPLAEQ